MRALRNVLVILALLATMVAGATPAWSADTPGNPDRLNRPLPANAGRYTVFEVSPDGTTVVYQTDQDAAGEWELFSVPIAGGVPTKISGAMQPDGDVRTFDAGFLPGFVISPDSSTVVYYADQDTDEVVELYSVPIGGGTVAKLSGPMTTGGDIRGQDVLVTPDSSTVVYRADQDTNGVTELYSVPIGGGLAVKLNGPLVPGGDSDVLFGSMVSPDSSTVIYRADQDSPGVPELYSVPIGGGSATKLNAPLVTGGSVHAEWLVTSDSSAVIYQADQDTDNVNELYSVPIAGGATTKLNGALVTGGDVRGFDVSPDSSTVIYGADQDTNNVFEIYSVPVSGGTPTKLNPPLATDRSTGVFKVSPDSSTVVYGSDQDTNDVFELYSVPVGGGTSTKLNSDVAPNRGAGNAIFSPDSSRVVYTAGQVTSGVRELYSVPITGGTSTKLSGPMTSGGDVLIIGGGIFTGPAVSPDSSRVFYSADQDTDGVVELFSAPIDGGTAVKLNGPLGASGRFGRQGFALSADSSRVVYQADQNGNGAFDIFSVLVAPRCAGQFATIVGTNGSDTIRGTSGPDVIAGLGGNDVIRGRGGDDLICGGSGDDTISGNRGEDTIFGGKGADTIFGNSGRDTIYGGSGNDVIEGGKRGDTIFGRSGDDILRGKSGNDELRGGRGTDICRGGTGIDTAFSCETASGI